MNFEFISIRLPRQDGPGPWGEARISGGEEMGETFVQVKVEHISTFEAFQKRALSARGIRLTRPPGNWKTLVAEAVREGGNP